jgi:flagellin
MRINHNIAAINTYNKLSSNSAATSGSLEKLSSGLKINKAGDDAAGLAISEKMRGQIRGLDMAQKNAQDGISLIQTAEGALNETHSILQRMRELSTQSANDTNTDSDRAELQKEVDQLSEELTRIADNTEFNTQNLLNGEFKGTFHIGANSNQNLELSINKMDANALHVAGAAGAQFDITSAASKGTGLLADGSYDVVKLDDNSQVNNVADDGTLEAKYGLKGSDGKIHAVSSDGKEFATLKTAVSTDDLSTGQVNVDYGDTGTTNVNTVFADEVVSGKVTVDTGVASAKATVEETTLKNDTYTVKAGSDVAATDAQYALLNKSGDLVAQSADGQSWKSVNDVNGEDVLTTSTALTTADTEIVVGSQGGLNISTQKSADEAITTINDAIETVSAERSKLGAYQNRLDHTINNLSTSSENLTAAESRIRDVDYSFAA